jgi:lipopolysaccharide export system permease protein
MINGNRQELSRADGRVSFLFFDRYTIDIDRATGDGALRQRETTERYLGELLDPDDVTDPKTRAAFLADGHQRIVSPLYIAAFVLIALAVMLSGDFTRRGQSDRVLLAIGLVVVVQALGIGLANLAGKAPALIPLMYVNAIAPIALALYVLYFGMPQRQPGRRIDDGAPDPGPDNAAGAAV